MASISRFLLHFPRSFLPRKNVSSFLVQFRSRVSTFKFKPLPSIQNFNSCQEYLQTVLKDKDRQLKPEDWGVILEDITGTLPAKPEKAGATKEYNIKMNRINSFSRNRFAFLVCAEIKSLHGIVTLYYHLKDCPEKMSNSDKSAFCSSVIQINCIDNPLENQVIEICNELLDSEDLSLVSAAIGAISTTRDWMRGFRKWKEHCDDPSFFMKSPEIQALGLAALRNMELHLLWEIVGHRQFHKNYLSIRGKGRSPEHQKGVFLEYIKMLNREGNASVDDFYGFEMLFKKFREINYCDNNEVEEEIAKFFDGRRSVTIKTRVYSPDGHCSTCDNRSEKWNISREDSEKLKRDIYERTLVVDDAYKNTDPKEIEGFFDKLHSLPRKYDIVIDGPNVCLTQIRGVARVRYDFQSKSLLHVLRELKRVKMDPLVIHNHAMLNFKDLEEIESLCQYILLDKHTKDDPLFMMAALDTKNLPEDENVNRRLLLTKDTLQQHECVLSSDEIRKLFTHWQAFHQVPFSIIKEDDAYRVYLYFPKHRDLTASKTEVGSWHIPLSFYDNTEDAPGRKSMMYPRKYLCISKTKNLRNEDHLQNSNSSEKPSMKFSSFLNDNTT